MLRSFFYIIISVALVSCGKEQGVEAKLHRKTNVTPQMVVTNAAGMLPTKKSAGQENSISSQSIRQDTYGFRVQAQANTTGSTIYTVEHFERLPDNSCRNTIHSIDVPTNKLQNWNASSTMQVRCYDSSCSYLLLVLEQSGSSFTDGNGAIVPAYVPVILEKTTKPSGGTYYEATLVSTMPFLKLEVDTTCMNSSQVVKYPTHFAISPVDDYAPKYDYYPDPYNNTWIY